MLSSSEGSYTPIVDIVDEHGHDPGSRDGSRILCHKCCMNSSLAALLIVIN